MKLKLAQSRAANSASKTPTEPARDWANFNFNYTPYVVTAVLFVALTVPLARFTDYLGRRTSRRVYGRAAVKAS